ncbi:PilN domain-containing protein [Bradyrhizobium sp. BR 1432]|uniref:PilN domain-containing protein n=1 Tax=Bradyrhizobium sp. BR 1432 TaxID=3447966 RepID=UPI003EE7AF8F
MISELKELFATWMAAVAAAIDAVGAKLVRRRQIVLIEGQGNGFTARVTSTGTGASLPELSFRLVQNRPEPAVPPEWAAALRGSQLDIVMRRDHVLVRPLDFPKQAADFLDGMIRTQIDRLTPWTASDAVFGTSPPAPLANERIGLMLAATSRQKIEPLVRLAGDLRVSSVAGLVDLHEAESEGTRIRLFEAQPSGAGRTVDVPRLLRLGLGLAAAGAAASLIVSTYVGGMLDAEQHELQQHIAQRRAALRINQTGGSAETLLAKLKQTTPSSVVVLEAVSRVLPDTTYVTELRVEGDKMQVVGMTQDAPSLIRLIEQSPHFTRATFFAPTTRGQSDPGERFHIEARMTPYFGDGS